MLSKEFTKWIILANLIVFPVAYFLMRNWFQDFAYRADIGYSVFLFSGFIALMIAVITVSILSVKAALANPIKSLRFE